MHRPAGLLGKYICQRFFCKGVGVVSSAVRDVSESAVDAFVDALWLEDGLSRNTLQAYRRDLSLFAQWLAVRGKVLNSTTETDLSAYFGARHAETKATTANRRLTVFKRYFRWAVREHQLTEDPTLKLQSARQALRVPKTMSEAQVDALLGAPPDDTPLGLRDKPSSSQSASTNASTAKSETPRTALEITPTPFQ